MANRIAEAFIELKVRGTQAVRSTLKAVGFEVKDLGDDAEEAGGRISETVGLLERFQSLLGKLLIPVAIFAALKGIVDKFVQLNKEAEQFRRNLQEASAAAQQQAEISRQQADGVESLQEKLASISREYQSQIDPLQKQVDELSELESIAGRVGRGLAQDIFPEQDIDRASKILSLTKSIDEIRATRDSRLSQVREEFERESRVLAEQIDLQNLQAEAELKLRDAAKETNAERRAQLETEAENIKLQAELIDNANAIDEAIRRAGGNEEDPLVVALFRRRKLLLEFNKEALAGIETRKNAEIDAQKKIRDEIIKTNRAAAEETRRALQEIVATLNSQGPAFSQLEDLVASIADEVRQIRGRTP